MKVVWKKVVNTSSRFICLFNLNVNEEDICKWIQGVMFIWWRKVKIYIQEKGYSWRYMYKNTLLFNCEKKKSSLESEDRWWKFRNSQEQEWQEPQDKRKRKQCFVLNFFWYLFADNYTHIHTFSWCAHVNQCYHHGGGVVRM